MSLLNVVKCDACGKFYEIGPMMGSSPYVARDLPDGWYSLLKGNPQANMEVHFCSAACVGQHLQVSIQLPEAVPEQAACKARRFLLVDGETADITEGVKWEGGSVTLDGGEPSYPSWDELKATREGSGVQWIDQEVSG